MQLYIGHNSRILTLMLSCNLFVIDPCTCILTYDKLSRGRGAYEEKDKMDINLK